MGDVGMLKHRGDKLLDWKEPTPDRPLEELPGGDVTTAQNSSQPAVFISYTHEAENDARYVAEFLQSRGIDVWIDRDAIRYGDRLSTELEQAIRRADFFIPLLSHDYWGSQWCTLEFELAADLNCSFMPIKISVDEPARPRWADKLYREQLGEPVYLDLYSRDATRQLDRFARQLRARA